MFSSPVSGGTGGAGVGAERVAFDGANIWVTNAGDSNNGATVTKLSANDGTLLGTFEVGEAPVGIAYDGANM
jgi:DNA-binding beta-propeller fold protein YncE